MKAGESSVTTEYSEYMYEDKTEHESGTGVCGDNVWRFTAKLNARPVRPNPRDDGSHSGGGVYDGGYFWRGRRLRATSP